MPAMINPDSLAVTLYNKARACRAAGIPIEDAMTYLIQGYSGKDFTEQVHDEAKESDDCKKPIRRETEKRLDGNGLKDAAGKSEKEMPATPAPTSCKTCQAKRRGIRISIDTHSNGGVTVQMSMGE